MNNSQPMQTTASIQSASAVRRLRFASRYAVRHLGISVAVALASAAVVFGLWYPAPYRQMLQVGHIYLLVLVVDVVCGPLLTLVLASPKKSRRERWLDFSFVGVIQLVALAYGMHSVWVARPVVLAFEADRLKVVTANEVEAESLPKAPTGLQHLPWAGVLQVGTRRPISGEEMVASVRKDMAGLSRSLRPDWWLPWTEAREAMRSRAKPLAELIARRPEAAPLLQAAAKSAGHAVKDLTYLPLVSSKTLDWVALLDSDLNIVGHAPVDGF